MWKKILVAGVAGAAALGGGAAALAATTTAGPATPSQPAAGSATHHRHRTLVGARDFEHGTWVTRHGHGSVTHDAIRGTVTAISPSSVTVKAADGTSMTFRLDAHTKVVLREDGKGSRKTGTAAEVKANDHVLVTGTAAGATLTARHLLDTGAK